MAAALVLALALLALQPGLKSNEVADVETTERMQQREAYLNEQMTRLLQEVERSRSTEETTLLSGLEQWWFWTIPAVLVLFAVVCWLERGAIFPSACCSEQASSGSKQENGKEEEEFTGLPNGVRSLSTPTPPPRQGLPNKCKLLKELVDDLLSVCRVLSERNFMPQLFPGTGMDDPCEAWSLEEKGIAYHLLVFLRPPPGHSFSLDLDTTKQLPGRPSNIHVALQCTCWKKQLLGGCACFLHHHDNKVPRARRSFLLENLCTSSYLDVEKVARWAQLLVTSAWQFLPESHHCQLTVLPSSKSCKFQLTSIAEINIVTEMFFAVEQENRGAYLRTTSDLGATD